MSVRASLLLKAVCASLPQIAHDSTIIKNLPVPVTKLSRSLFIKDANWNPSPPIISKSEFVPASMVEHLMRRKKDSALAIKYTTGSHITNMEGALHTFVTPICGIHMTGDYKYQYGHNAVGFNEPGDARPCIMSAAIQPDFEKTVVMLVVLQCTETPTQGVDLGEDWEIPSPSDKSGAKTRLTYEQQLLFHMIYHLHVEHTRPGTKTGNRLSYKDGMAKLKALISQDPIDGTAFDPAGELKGCIIECNGYPLSMEMLFHVYLHQLRNELSILERACDRGYVYTIDPPAIFAQVLGTGGTGAAMLNRFQALAFKALASSNDLSKLHTIGFNDYLDKNNIAMLKKAFEGRNGHVQIRPKADLFTGQGGRYNGPSGATLVLHNNSDGFGQNIETEGMSSMDGVLGSCSDAAKTLVRDRKDLLDHIV